MNGESHRVYWQRWAVSNGTTKLQSSASSSPTEVNRSRRDLITSSAAVRITPEAKAEDVTKLLRESSSVRSALLAAADHEPSNSLQSPSSSTTLHESDAIVLVGTLYSLPPHFIRFEHEKHQMQHEVEQQTISSQEEQRGPQSSDPVSIKLQGYQNRSTPRPLHNRNAFSSQAVHVVRTLRPDENPNAIRKLMADRMRRLQRSADLLDSSVPPSTDGSANIETHVHSQPPRTAISPKLQFYFIHPLLHNPTLDLEGYCTSLEDDDDDDDNNEVEHDCGEESCDHENVEQHLLHQFPWLASQGQTQANSAESDAVLSGHSVSDEQRLLPEVALRKRNEQYRRTYLLQTTSQSTMTCLSGYLLKRSLEDPHVWRRIHCVLTDDRFWYVTRVYGDIGAPRYRSIRLASALLIARSLDRSGSRHHHDENALQPAPFCFEVVSAAGVSHYFRATSQRSVARWIPSLQARIDQSAENGQMELASLILRDESVARSKREVSYASLPLWKAAEHLALSEAHVNSLARSSTSLERLDYCGGPFGIVLRWGLDVADFRETCKYMHSRLPPKSLVLASEQQQGSSSHDDSDDRRRAASSPGATTINGPIQREPLDPMLFRMIQHSWEHAGSLLARAMHIGSQVLELQHQQMTSFRGSSNHRDPVRLSSIETHCRHVEYILTGSFRPLRRESGRESDGGQYHTGSGSCHSDTNNGEPRLEKNERFHCQVSASSRHCDPPPIDLFDQLLLDLQGHAAAAMADARNDGTPIGDEASKPFKSDSPSIVG